MDALTTFLQYGSGALIAAVALIWQQGSNNRREDRRSKAEAADRAEERAQTVGRETLQHLRSQSEDRRNRKIAVHQDALRSAAEFLAAIRQAKQAFLLTNALPVHWAYAPAEPALRELARHQAMVVLVGSLNSVRDYERVIEAIRNYANHFGEPPQASEHAIENYGATARDDIDAEDLAIDPAPRTDPGRP